MARWIPERRLALTGCRPRTPPRSTWTSMPGSSSEPLPASHESPSRVGFSVGSKWQYSGDGYLVVQQLMMGVTGESFPRVMREAVFDRLGMRHGTFEQPIPDSVASSTSAGTLKNGSPVPGRWHVQLEIAGGGLWTTPLDLARL